MSEADRAARVTAGPFTMPSFRQGEAVAAEISDPVLARVLAPGSVFVEQFRILRAKIEAIGKERPLRCIGLVSARAGEGTTTAAIGLARSLAEEKDRRVLLIEADLHKPLIERRLGLAREPGLADWLRSPTDMVSLRRLEPWGFSLLGGGHTEPSSAALLESPDMVRLLESAIRSFDYVLVDCPALIPAADSVMLQDLLDGFLLVVRARRCPPETLTRALSHLKSGLIQGVIFTEDRHILSRSTSYFYSPRSSKT
jgi:Mrp family chromosome partitioning ATPase